MVARMYPGRDSNPHAMKAVALKATVSDQFHHPGVARDATGNAREIQARRAILAGRFSIDSGIERLLGSEKGALGSRPGTSAGGRSSA
jgi:hypothetical protein